MSENCSLWSLLLSGQKANIQLNLHTATFLQRPIFGRIPYIDSCLNLSTTGLFLLSQRSPFYLLARSAKVANWSQVSLHCWKSGIWSSLIIWLVTKYHWTRAIIVQLWLLHWAYFHLKSTLLVRTPRYKENPTKRTTAKSRVNNNLQAFDWNKIRTLANEDTNQTNSRSLRCPP